MYFDQRYRNDSPKVVMPGEFIEVYADDLKPFNGEVSIEPRIESPLSGNWPKPSMSRVTRICAHSKSE